MAFSFRAGTNWCHDFPKLARESGFYFNMHRTRVRVDWNRICSLNIDQVIQESDFQTVDDNVNNVIDYSLEHEYDVKILDPNFVKLFRLAQLAVEYLLYCKQYLDQSVVILKDELKIKIEENVKLKKDIASMTECIRELKERNRSIDLRISPQGEVHKCPYCPKSFVSAVHVNAHISRRHSTSSPVPDEYKNETEKLHNEIKMLKERLNQTEKFINESNKWHDSTTVEKSDDKVEKLDKAQNTEETSFKVHIDKPEKSDKSSVEINKCIEDTNAALISELKLRMEDDMENLQSKLTLQENYWKSKIENLQSKLTVQESRHHQDIENLFSQLKVTQQAASRMKSEYESKIQDLERQSHSQSEMINAQTEMLRNISIGIQDCKLSQSKSDVSREESNKKHNGFLGSMEVNKLLQRSQDISDSMLESSSESSAESVKRKPQQTLSHLHEEVQMKTDTKRKEKEAKKDKNSTLIDEFINQTSKKLKRKEEEKKRKMKQEESESKESCSDEETETGSESEESETTSETKTETEVSETATESVTDDQEKPKRGHKSEDKRRENPATDDLKEDMREMFNRKMQNLGIDPDWEGIPKATFKQKSNMLRHHQKINAKKFPKYMNIRERLLMVELPKKLTSKHKEPNKTETPKQSLLSKVKMRAMKAFNMQKSAPKSPVMQKQITHPRRPDPRQLFASTRTRKMSLDDAELRKALDKDLPIRGSDSRLNSRSADGRLLETSGEVRKHASYETIEDFIRGTRKSEMSSKASSTPMKNAKPFVEHSYEDESDNVSMSSDVGMSSPMSPKGSKSVLKMHPASAASTIKKRVEFDLDNKRSFGGEPVARAISFGEVTEYSMKRRNSVDSDLNVSSISDERIVPRKREQINVVSRKVASVSDTSGLSSPTMMIEDFERSSTTNIRSPLRTREQASRTPQAAPRNLTKSSVQKSVPDMSTSSLDADMAEILEIT